MPQALSGDQLKLVLRRAAELEREGKQQQQGEVVPDLDVREIADEVGIAPEAVQRALAEMNAGVLVAAPPAPRFLDRAIGPAEITVEREVPIPPAVARARVDTFLEGQLLRVARRFGDRTVWRPERSLWSRVRRALDVTQRFELPRDTAVDSIILPHGEGSLIRFVARLEEPQKKRAAAAVSGIVLGAAVGGVGVALADPVLWDAISVAVGAGMAAGAVGMARRGHRHDCAAAAETLERFLDHI